MKKNIKKINRNSHKNLNRKVWRPGIMYPNDAFYGICLDYTGNSFCDELSSIDL